MDCSSRSDDLKSNLYEIIRFYFDLPLPGTAMTEAFIHVCIVCDLYYEMRSHLIENEKKLGLIVNQLIYD